MTPQERLIQFSRMLVLNQQRECEVPGCCRKRQKVARYCDSHARAYRQLGHPLARPLDARQWRDKRLQVRQLFEANPTHPGLVNMTAYLTQYLAGAAQSDSAFSGAREVGRLARHGVSPLDLLVEACSCWSYLEDNPRAVPDDRSAATAVARAVLQLAPRPRRAYRPSVKSLREPGTTYPLKARSTDVGAVAAHLRELLAPLVVNVHAALKQREQQKARALEALRQPFEAPAAALIAEEVTRERQP
jgi:hypothetical protein